MLSYGGEAACPFDSYTRVFHQHAPHETDYHHIHSTLSLWTTPAFRPQPRLGCWELLSTSYNGGLDVEKEACLYVGDAAGRPKQGTYKKVKTRVDRVLLKCERK